MTSLYTTRVKLGTGALTVAAAGAAVLALLGGTAFASGPLGGTSHNYNWVSGVPSGDGLESMAYYNGGYQGLDDPPVQNTSCVGGSGGCTVVEIFDYSAFGGPQSQDCYLKYHMENYGGYLTPQIDSNSKVTFTATSSQHNGQQATCTGLTTSATDEPLADYTDDVAVTNNMPSGHGTEIKFTNGNAVVLTTPGQQYFYNASSLQVSWILSE